MTTSIETRVINLARRGDRRDEISKRLIRAGIHWDWHVATDARSVDRDELTKSFATPSRAYPPTSAELACSLSHFACWKKFLEGDAKALCVLEDDVFFGEDLAHLLADDSWITPGHGLVKLDTNSATSRRILVSDTQLKLPLLNAKLYRLYSRRLGAGGYIAHRDVIKKLSETLPGSGVAVDHCLFNPPHAPHFRSFGAHIIVPSLVFHDHSGSDIHSSRQEQKNSDDWHGIKRARFFENSWAMLGRLRAILFKGARFRVFPGGKKD